MAKSLTAEDKLLKVFRTMDKNKDGNVDLKEFMDTMAVLGTDQFSEQKLRVMLEIADANKDGIVQYEEFIDWLFGKRQRVMAMSVGTAALLQQLLEVEGNQMAEHHLLTQLQTKGCCMIATIHFEGQDSITELSIYKYLRALFALRVWDDDVRLIKSDGPRFFVYSVTPAKALKAALKMRAYTDKFGAWLDSVFPGQAQLKEGALCSIGLKEGSLVLIEGDCYGDPVNVASKLGEDIAKPGELLVAMSCVMDQNDPEMVELLKDFQKTELKRDISGLTLHYVALQPSPTVVDKVSTNLTSPNLEDTRMYLEARADHGDLEQYPNSVVLTTDLSGFTRLTKQYGILHFLRLVLKCRSIIVPAINSHGGRKIKYEGDNVIGVFPNSDAAVCCMALVWKQLADYNNSRSKDFQIRAGCGLGAGDVAILGHDIIGGGFDRSFRLAEDEAETGEILIDENIRAQGWPSLKVKHQVSEQRDVKDNDDESKVLYHCWNISLDQKSLGGDAVGVEVSY